MDKSGVNSLFDNKQLLNKNKQTITNKSCAEFDEEITQKNQPDITNHRHRINALKLRLEEESMRLNDINHKSIEMHRAKYELENKIIKHLIASIENYINSLKEKEDVLMNLKSKLRTATEDYKTMLSGQITNR